MNTPEQLKANFRLAAAAPDLLAACKAIVVIQENEAYDVQARDEMATIARAAIAKAEGGVA